jgi:hypothetical protein
MIDHQRFRLLAAARVDGQLTPEEMLELEEHLASCPVCRTEAAQMARDQGRLVAGLADVPVSDRLRSTVVGAARGQRRFSVRPLLAAAALLLVALAGVAFIAGSRTPVPSPSPGLTTTPSPAGLPTSTPSTGIATVNGAYAYHVGPDAERRDSISAQDTDPPSGTWSRLVPPDGAFLGGPITCLVIDGPDAWMAGPATESSDGTTWKAALLYVHDGGEPDGLGDTAVTWITDPGQTLATMEGWCAGKYIPAGPYPVEVGDIIIRPGG